MDTKETTNTKIYAKGVTKNFPDVTSKQYYSLEDMKQGDCSGTTDTDSSTDDTDNHKGYTHIYKTHGKQHGT